MPETMNKRHKIIRASAGTGKTFELEKTVAELIIEEDYRIDEILILTYTEAATAQLRHRIRLRLQSELQNQNDQRKRASLQSSLSDFDKCYLHTIHGFCNRINREYNIGSAAIESAQLTNSSNIISKLLNHYLRALQAGTVPLTSSDYSALLFTDFADLPARRIRTFTVESVSLFNQFQKKLPLPGRRNLQSGNIQILVEQILTIMQRQNEVFARYREHLGNLLIPAPGKELLWHKFILGKVMIYQDVKEIKIDYTKFLQIYSQKNGIDLPDELNQTWHDYLKLLEESQKFKDDLSDLAMLHLAERISDEQSDHEREKSLITYRSMIADLEADLKNRTDLRKKLQAKFKVGLLDEFQDTDPLQWSIFEQIFTQPDTDNFLIIVGDTKQSMYGFRGADVSLFDLACDRLTENNNGTVKILQENYRSTENLIGAFNSLFTVLFEGAAGRYEFLKKFPQKNHKSYLKNSGGWEKTLQTIERSVLNLFVPEFSEDLKQENRKYLMAEEICSEMLRLYEKRAELLIADKRSLDWQDMVVLIRNLNEGQEITAAMSRYGIPWELKDKENIWLTTQAIEFKIILQAIDDPHNRRKLLTAALTPVGNFSQEQLHNQTFSNALAVFESQLFDLNQLAQERKWGKVFASLENIILRNSHCTDHFENKERVQSNFETLCRYFSDFAIQSGADLKMLLRHANEVLHDTETVDLKQPLRISTDSTVSVMTIHKSKGLEFPVVFITGLNSPMQKYPDVVSVSEKNEKGNYEKKSYLVFNKPDKDLLEQHQINSQGELDLIDEVRKICYVAVTRAQYYCWLPVLTSKTPSFLTAVGKLLSPGLESLQREKHITVYRKEEKPETESDFDSLRAPCNLPNELKPGFEKNSVTAWQRPDMQNILYRRNGIQSFSSLSRRVQSNIQTIETTEDEQQIDSDQNKPEEFVDQGLLSSHTTGYFLHSLLELIPFSAAKQWQSQNDIVLQYKSLIEDLANENRIRIFDPDGKITDDLDLIVTETAGILWNVMHCPFINETCSLCDIPDSKTIKELGFLMSDTIIEQEIPEIRKDRSSGFVTGFIDLFFEWQGKYYFVDYKSSLLKNYQLDSVKSDFQKKYLLQAQIYEKAVIAHLGTKKNLYGGYYYLYLRGLRKDNPNSGILKVVSK